MLVKKSGGKVFGATFTADEKKAIDMEVRRLMAEYDRKNAMEIDAIVLWQLHTQLGFGPVRLKKFFEGFRPAAKALLERYEMAESDQVWLQTHELKEIGVDLEEWYKEAGI